MTILGPDNQPMSLAEIPGILSMLRHATQAALDRAEFDEGMDGLGSAECVRAEHFEDHEGRAGWRVWIDEAAPEADQLKEFVRNDLAAHGWPGVEVVTEW